MASKRRTRSSGVRATAASKSTSTRRSKRNPLQAIENCTTQNDTPKRETRKGASKSNQNHTKKDNDSLLESLLTGDVSGNSSIEFFIEVKSGKNNTKKKTDVIQISKFQKGRNGKLEFVPTKGKPVVFNEKKHHLVQKKRKSSNSDGTKSSKRSKSKPEMTSVAISDDEENMKKERKKENFPENEEESKTSAGSMPQDLPSRTSRRNTNKKTNYKDDDDSVEAEHDDGSVSEESKEDAEFTPSKKIKPSPSRKSSSKKKSPYQEMIERETTIKIGSSWVENDSDWRVLGAMDY